MAVDHHPSWGNLVRVTLGAIDFRTYLKKRKYETLEQTKDRARKLEQELIERHGLGNGPIKYHGHKVQANNLHSHVRGIGITYAKAFGRVTKHPHYVKITVQISVDGKVRVFSRLSRNYTKFLSDWDEAVDKAIEFYGLTRAKTGWRKAPLNKKQYYEYYNNYWDK